MTVTFTEYMRENPDVTILGGKDLDHDMEYDESTGFEKCNRCGFDETEIDEVCPESSYASFLVSEWGDYVEIEPGVARFRLEQD